MGLIKEKENKFTITITADANPRRADSNGTVGLHGITLWAD